MSSSQHKHDKQSLLTSVAESIGSTLGTIACQVTGVPEAISRSNLVKTAERGGKKFARGSQAVARKIGAASKKVTSKKLAKARRHELRRGKKKAKRVIRPFSVRRKNTRKGE